MCNSTKCRADESLPCSISGSTTRGAPAHGIGLATRKGPAAGQPGLPSCFASQALGTQALDFEGAECSAGLRRHCRSVAAGTRRSGIRQHSRLLSAQVAMATHALNSGVHMIPYIHLVNHATLISSPAIRAGDNVFDLVFGHSKLGTLQTCRSTHLSSTAAATLSRSVECEVHVVALDMNSLAAHLLAGRPQFVVTGIAFPDGRRVQVLPHRLLRVRRWGLAASVSATVLGLGIAPLGFGFVGAALAAVGALAFRTFAAIPGKSFWGHEDDLGLNTKAPITKLCAVAAHHAPSCSASPVLLDVESQNRRAERDSVQ